MTKVPSHSLYDGKLHRRIRRNIQILMNANDWTLADLAREAKIADRTLRPQFAKPSFTLDAVVKIADALGVQTSDLLGENERVNKALQAIERMDQVLRLSR